MKTKGKDLRFEPPSIIFPNTYISAESRYIVEAINESDTVYHLSFRKYSSEEEEKSEMNQLDILNPADREKFQNLVYYNSDVFHIEPNDVEVWPNSKQQFFITFTPRIALHAESIIFVEVKGLQERMSIKVEGLGLPPVASFKTPNISVGNVFLDSIYEYKVLLVNEGKVAVDFAIEPKDTGDLKFEFSPESGKIPVEGKQPIMVKFIASNVGSFNKTFTFRVKGAIKFHPTLNFVGKVIGPSFEVSPRMLDFGGVGYGFLHTEVLTIENKSEIPFDYTLRLQIENTYEKREFQIEKEHGFITKYGREEISIDFIPIAVRKYKLSLFLDIARFGKGLCEIPITAKCVCPELQLEPEVIEMQTAYIGHQYEEEIIICNPSDYPAKVEFIPQTEGMKKEAIMETTKVTAIIGAKSRVMIPILFRAMKIGSVTSNGFFRVAGSEEAPLRFQIKANCVGPTISFNTQQINFGNVTVLKTAVQNLEVKNTSLIRANFRASIESATGGFLVKPQNGVAEPGETTIIEVETFLNDVLPFSGTLKVCFDYLNAFSFPLKAQGVGSPVTSTIEMKTIDFGMQLTEQQIIKKFTMKNHANRSCEIRWSNVKVKLPKDISCDFKYKIVPDHIVLEPKQSSEFEMIISCSAPTSFVQNATCHCTIQRQRFEIFTPTIKGSFVSPMIVFDPPCLDYCMVYPSDKDGDRKYLPTEEYLMATTKSVEITNRSKLSLHLEADSMNFFSSDKKSFIIEPGESEIVQITFDPRFKEEFVTEEFNKKFNFSIVNHPQKASIPVHASVVFPNIKLEADPNVDFGVLMMNTEKTIPIKVRNTVPVPVDVEWELISESSKISQIFDVFPLDLHLEPGESSDVFISFYAMNKTLSSTVEFSAKAVGHVLGGPDYVLNLQGKSAPIEYNVAPTDINFGQVNYMDELHETVTFTNLSSVPIGFEIRKPKHSKFNTFNVEPMNGIVNSNDAVDLIVTLIPGVPREYNESFYVQISGFDDVQVRISADARFAQVLLNLPRAEMDPARYNLRLKQEKHKPKVQQKEVGLVQSSAVKALAKTAEAEFSDEELLAEERIMAVDFLRPKSRPSNDSSYIAIYEANFGETILGESKHLAFDIINTSPFPITAHFDTTHLKRTGFRIDPTAMKNVLPGTRVPVEIVFVAANRRMNEIGAVEYSVPIIFQEKHMVNVVVKGDLKIPAIRFSENNFDFGGVVVGQNKVMTMQLQNMNTVSCEFQIGTPKYITGARRADAAPVFRAVPSQGMLPPSSYMNISIHFEPVNEKAVEMEFPITLKHSTEPQQVIAKGYGVLYKLQFEPKEAILPPMMPFGGPSNTEVKVINPTPHPIDFYSIQFDRQMRSDPLPDPRQVKVNFETDDPRAVLESPFVTYTPKTKTPVTASKFGVCIIVNGSPCSGKSSIAANLSSIFGLPVIDLKEVWKNVSDDFVLRLYSMLCESRCRNGIIIDGLDALEDTGENELFMQQCQKLKNASDECQKKPFTNIPHTTASTLEQACDYVLSSLDGHYVFQIAVRIPPNVSTTRKEEKLKGEQAQKLDIEEQERVRLMSMTTEEYLALSEEEQMRVDVARAEFRKKEIESIVSVPSELLITTRKKPSKEEPSKQKKAKNQPMDPMQIASLVYNFSLGSITAKIGSPGERHKVIDPSELVHNEVAAIEISGNTILLDGSLDIDSIITAIMSYLPPLQVIKEAAFKRMIPEATVFDDPQVDVGADAKDPGCFMIEYEEPPQLANAKKKGDAEEPQQGTPKWHLDGNSSMMLKISASPGTIGNQTADLQFMITRCKMKPAVLKASVNCGYPEFDRTLETMFAKVSKKVDMKNPGFVIDTNELNFGYCIVQKERGKGSFAFRSTVTIQNISPFPIELASWIDTSGKAIFGFDPSNVTIQPNEKAEISASFHPTMTGSIRSKAAFLIKDNPEPFNFVLYGECVQPQIDINTSNIEFDKILTQSSKSRNLVLKNSGKMTAFWRLKGSQNFTGCVSFSSTEGELKPNKSATVVMTLSSAKAVTVKKPIQVEVCESSTGRVFTTHTININGEVFDVNFDVSCPKGMDDCLDFGTLKVNQPKVLQMQMKNRGKYPVEFRFTISDAVSKALKIVPMEGTLAPSDKPPAVQVTFCSATVASFNKQKAFTLKVVDTQTNAVTATITYQISCEAFFTMFTFDCPKKFDFGQIIAGVSSKREYTLVNTGAFPLEFDFKTKVQEQTDQKTTKGKKEKANTKVVTNGPFSISPASGSIQPKASQTIVVEAQSSTGGESTAVFQLAIPGTQASDSFSTKLSAAIFVPGIVNDTAKIFNSIPLLMKSDIAKNDQICFLDDEKTIHFGQCVVGKSLTVPIKFINPIPLEIAIDASIKAKAKGQTPFELSDKALIIPGNSSKLLQVSFKPTSTDNYSCQFEAVVKGGLDASTKSFKCNIEGNGTLPSIALLSELERGKGNSYIALIGRTLVGQQRIKSIAITNEKTIPATVSITSKPSPDLEIEGVEGDFVLDPGHSFEFRVIFAPQKVRKSTFDVSIGVLENPKANFSISFSAEGFSEDIVFEGLEGEDNELVFQSTVVGRRADASFTIKNVSESDVKFQLSATNDISFTPKVGHLRSGQSKEIVAGFFSEKPTKYTGGKCSCSVTRIEYVDEDVEDWDDSMKVVSFVARNELEVESPRRKTISKQNPSTRSKKMTAKEKAEMERLADLERQKEEEERRNQQKEKLIKVAQVKPEPVYKVVGQKAKELQLKVFAVSDILKCTIDTTEISFAPTMMYQERYYEVKVTNTSQIRMEYTWELKTFESLRTEYAQIRPPAFSIEPTTGIIEGGSTTAFRVSFAPMEVDDFTGVFEMKVPYLTAVDPPRIAVSALSRRPLCHFNVAVSDYLTRRHPDYKDPLPDDVKVVEVFAKGVNQRGSFKIEIINPTSSPYEAKWTTIKDPNGCVSCDSRTALVSSGKHYFFPFSFIMRSAKPVESLWEFSIPSHQVKVYFLFVARISKR